MQTRSSEPLSRALPGGRAALLSVVALALAACGDGGTPDTEGAGAAAATADASTAARPAPCEVADFPCTWGNVDADARRRTHELGWAAADVIQRTASVEETAAFLRAAGDVVDVWAGPFSVQFRVRGGRPAWVDLPFDPENPRLGGGGPHLISDLSAIHAAPGTPSATSIPPHTPAAAPSVGPLAPRAPQRGTGDGDRNGVAARDGEEGTGKRALLLSPVAWQLGELDEEARALEETRDYDDRHGGEVIYRANVDSLDDRNPTGVRLPELDARADGSTEVRLDDFMSWDDYNFIYLLTHGRTRCNEAGGECYTILQTGQRFTEDAAALGDLEATPGVELSYTTSGLNYGGASGTQRRACIAHLNDRSDPEHEVWRNDEGVLMVASDGAREGGPDTAPGADRTPDPGYTGAPPVRCFAPPEDVTHPIVNVTTEFFRNVYLREDRRLDNVVIFLAACQSLKGDYLADVLTANGTTENVAILGFDEVSNTGWTARIGADLILAMTELGLDHEATYRELSLRYPRAPLTGILLADEDQPTSLAAARLDSRATNPTHARDVVELVDPLSAEELEDGAAVIALGAPGDGTADRIRIGMQLRGIDDDTDVDAIDVYLRVDDRESDAYALTHTVEDHVMRVGEEEVDLGFDLGDRETVDLEIRAELEGGGESRWSYDDVRLASWTLSVTSPSTDGRYAGFQGYFHEVPGIGRLSLCSSEGPHIQITAGAQAFDGPGTYVLGNGPGQQQGEVAISPSNWRGVPPVQARAALRQMKNFISGDGESTLHQPDGTPFPIPPPSTLEIARVTDTHVEGSIRGTYFRQTQEGAFERAEVSVSFAARREAGTGGLMSLMRRPGQSACVGPGGGR